MSRFVEHLRALAAALQALAATLGTLGGPGLLAAAFLDSSFLPLPEVVDGVMMWLVVTHPSRWLYYAAMPTIGSLIGCYVLYSLARKGGHAVLRKYLHESHIERGMAAFRRHGLLTVVVPAILPPPMPFKPFVLLVGVADVSPGMFIGAVLLGRGFRYGFEALLAYWYGAAAIEFVEHNMKSVSLGVALAVLAIGVGTLLWRRRRPS